MAYINRSTLTYPATNAFPNGIWEDTRDPTIADFRNFAIGVIWINFAADRAWIMVDKTVTTGIWILMATTGTGILTMTGDTGGAVGPDGANNINLLGGPSIVVSGVPGTNTLTIDVSAAVPLQFDEDVGSAAPALNILNIVGAGGITTSGALDTVTITAGGTLASHFTEDSGTATPVAHNLNILGGVGITTSGAGSTVTIDASGDVATLYTEDAGTAAPSGNNLNIVGSAGITTSGAGSTVTVTAGGTIPTQFTENTGTAIPAGNVLNVLGFSGISTTGAGNTISITPGSTLATLYTEDAGTAAPSGNNLNIKGSGGITTSGAGSTVTVIAGGTIPTSFVEDAGSAIPSAHVLNVIGGTGISTSGAGNTITITNTSTSSTTFNEDAGSATPLAGVLNVLGGSGISTTGAGNTITVINNLNTGKAGFLAFLSATVNNVTGDATAYTVIFDTEVFDIAGNYNNATGIFTCSVAGTYIFSTSINSFGYTAAMTDGSVNLFINGVIYRGLGGSPFRQAAGAAGDGGLNWDAVTIVHLSIGDTVLSQIVIAGGTKTVNIIGDLTQKVTNFSGALLF